MFSRITSPACAIVACGLLCPVGDACDLVLTTVDGATSLRLSGGEPFHTTRSAVFGAQCIELADSETALLVWTEDSGEGSPVPWSAVSPDGVTVARAIPTDYELCLASGSFDPGISSPAYGSQLLAGPDTHLYIIQFRTQPLSQFRSVLEGIGGTVLGFVPNHAFVVLLSDEASAVAEAFPWVRILLPLHPALRLERSLLESLTAPDAVVPPQRYYLQLVNAAPTQQMEVAARIESSGGAVHHKQIGSGALDVTLTGEQLLLVLRWDEVLFVQQWADPEVAVDLSRRASGANYLATAAEFTGHGVRGAVWDTTLYDQHPDYVPAPLHQTPVTGGFDCHGTNVYGVMFADGVGEPRATGILPDAEGVFVDAFVGPAAFGRYAYTCLSVVEPGQSTCKDACGIVDAPPAPPFPDVPDCPVRVVVQSNSWSGHSQEPEYLALAAAQDLAVFDFDLLVCQAQGNTSPCQCSFEEAWSKNVISVGGITHNDTTCYGDDLGGYVTGGACGDPPITYAGCTGPAGDGRFKPDLAHYYDAVLTTSNPTPEPLFCTLGGGCFPCALYRENFGGTSVATPIVCGYAGLFFEMWGKPKTPGSSVNIFGRTLPVPAGDVFDNRCHAATAKAMLINTARQYEFVNGINRYNSGWGSPDVRRIHELRDGFPVIVDEGVVLAPFEYETFNVTVEAGVPALKATMVYTDFPGSPGAGIHRVNDLSLRSVSPSGVNYVGNYGLETAHWSTPCPGHGYCELGDRINNVENIFIEEPEPGVWQFRVNAYEITMDGHPETPGVMDADFALVVSVDYPRCPETEVSTFCHSCCTITPCPGFTGSSGCPGNPPTGHANCCDANVCTFNRCTGECGECRFEGTKYGNVNGDANHLVNLDDIVCAMSCFSNYASCPNADIAPACTGNGICNNDDILAVLAAFGGADPCGCVVPQ